MTISLSRTINTVSGIALGMCILTGAISLTAKNELGKNISTTVAITFGSIAFVNKLTGSYLEQVASNKVQDQLNELNAKLIKAEETAKNLKDNDEFLSQLRAKNESKISQLEQELEARSQTLTGLNSELTLKTQSLTHINSIHAQKLNKLIDSNNLRVKKLYQNLLSKLIKITQGRIDSVYHWLHSAIDKEVNRLSSLLQDEPDSQDLIDIKEALTKFQGTLTQEENSHDEQVENLRGLLNQSDLSDETIIKNLVVATEIFDNTCMELANLKVRMRNCLNVANNKNLKRVFQDLQTEKSNHRTNYKAIGKYRQLIEDTNQMFDELEQKTVTQRDNAVESIDNALAKIQEVRETNFTLNQRLIELSKPQLWRPASRDDYKMGNVIIQYFEQYGYTLDKYDTEYKGYEGIVWFDAYRSKKRVICKDLNEHGEYLQQLCHSFNVPRFEYDGEHDKFRCYLQFAQKPKKEKNSNEVPRGVKPSSKFPKIVSKWKRVRITGGSESGKSPTAENVAVCMLKANPGTIDFYDPMYDSIKNYRTIPAVGYTHEDSIQGLRDYSKRMDNSPSEKFYLAWFDEIDTTVDENPACVKDIKAVIKQASHKNSGLILTGQNANVSAIKGLQRSDMNNLVLVHIGSNYRDGIDNSSLSNDEKELLKKVGDDLTDWCYAQNDKYGMEPTGDNADPNAYRFALVLEPQKRGYYIILPEFGQYTYESSEVYPKTNRVNNNTQHEKLANSSNLGNLLRGLPVTEVKPQCPNCNSTRVGTKGNDRYRCKDCNKTWSKDEN